MRKLLKKKVNVFGKAIPVFVLLLLGVGLVSAALITYWGTITGLVTVSQGLTVDGENWDIVITEPAVTMTSLDAKMITSGHYLENTADVDAIVYLKTTCIGGGDACNNIGITTDTVGLSTTWSSDANAFADASMVPGVVTLEADKNDGSHSSEARIVILGKDVGVETLSDLDSMSWAVSSGVGYAPHVDVYLDVDGDGEFDTDEGDRVLVFEHAKVTDSNCDVIGEYPTGGYNTFEDKGIVDDNAKAWMQPGPPGGCETQEFINNWWTLSNWKAGSGPSGISGSIKVLRFEIEVDAWGQMHDGTTFASAEISDIVINDVHVEINTINTGTIEEYNPIIVEGDNGLAFYVNSDFPKMLVPGTYNITTIVDNTA